MNKDMLPHTKIYRHLSSFWKPVQLFDNQACLIFHFSLVTQILSLQIAIHHRFCYCKLFEVYLLFQNLVKCLKIWTLCSGCMLLVLNCIEVIHDLALVEYSKKTSLFLIIDYLDPKSTNCEPDPIPWYSFT